MQGDAEPSGWSLFDARCVEAAAVQFKSQKGLQGKKCSVYRIYSKVFVHNFGMLNSKHVMYWFENMARLYVYIYIIFIYMQSYAMSETLKGTV